MKVAITGGIGSGKSHICRLLERRGISVYDCDKAAKRIMASSKDIQNRLTQIVGNDVYTGDTLNKAILAAYILSSEDNAQRINNVVHPAVADDFINSGYKWMECALLFSSGFNRLVDKVVCVTAPLEVRISRIANRDGISREKAYEWINRQMPQEDIAAKSDFIIVNDGTADVEQQINGILESLEILNK